MTVLTASQLMRPYRSADLVRLVSFAITVAALLERRCGQTRPKFDENTESGGCANADPTMVAIKIAPIAVRGRRC